MTAPTRGTGFKSDKKGGQCPSSPSPPSRAGTVRITPPAETGLPVRSAADRAKPVAETGTPMARAREAPPSTKPPSWRRSRAGVVHSSRTYFRPFAVGPYTRPNTIIRTMSRDEPDVNDSCGTEQCRVCESPLDMDDTHPIDGSLGWCGNCGEYRSPSLHTDL